MVTAKLMTDRAACGLYLLIAGPLCLLFLGRNDLIRMEPIIALGAEHMRLTGEWWVPRLYGEIYAYKPSLAYWLVAASQWVLGRGDFAIRLPSALCGLLLGLVICRSIGRACAPRAGLFAGLLAATSFLFCEQARMAGFDMPLALGVGVAVLAACRCLSERRHEPVIWMVGYAGLLFGFLAKGLPAVVLYFPGLIAAAVVLKRGRSLLGWQHLLGLIFFAVGTGVYLALAYAAESWAAFAQQYAEVTGRAREWTLVAVVATLATPVVVWLAFLPGSMLLVMLWRQRRSLPLDWQGFIKALLAFLTVGLLVFMANATSSTRYYLPLITPVAGLAGIAAETITRRREAAADNLNNSTSRPRFHLADRTAWTLTIVGMVYWAIFVVAIEPRKAGERSLRDVGMEFSTHVPAGTVVYMDTTDSFSSLAWYLDRPVRVWKFTSGESLPARVPLFAIAVNGQEVPEPAGYERSQLACVTAPDQRFYKLILLRPNTGTRLLELPTQ